MVECLFPMNVLNPTQVVAAYFNQMQAMNPAQWQALFASGGVSYDPIGNPPSYPETEAEKFFAMLGAAIEQMEVIPEAVFPVGQHHVAAKWTMRVVSKQGRQGEAEGITTFVLDDVGKIETVSSYWDDKALMAQLRGR